MRMVLDVNYAKLPELRTWLRDSASHQVVLLDTFAIETLRTDG